MLVQPPSSLDRPRHPSAEPEKRGRATASDAEDARRIGARIREARRRLGVSQQALAVEIGLTFQQVQKYEKGVNRVSAPALARIARSLDVDVAYLLGENLPAVGTGARAAAAADIAVMRRQMTVFAEALLAIGKAIDGIERSLGGAGEAGGLDG